MQKKTLLTIGVLLLLGSLLIGSSYATEPIPYSFFEKKGMEALTQGNYTDAVAFFKEALIVNPNAKDSLHFLNTIKRLQDGCIGVIEYEEKVRDLKKKASGELLADDILKDKGQSQQEYFPSFLPVEDSSVGIKREQFINQALFQYEKTLTSEAAVLPEEVEQELESEKELEISQDLSAPLEPVASQDINPKKQAMESALDFLEHMAGEKSENIPDFIESEGETTTLEEIVTEKAQQAPTQNFTPRQNDNQSDQRAAQSQSEPTVSKTTRGQQSLENSKGMGEQPEQPLKEPRGMADAAEEGRLDDPLEIAEESSSQSDTNRTVETITQEGLDVPVYDPDTIYLNGELWNYSDKPTVEIEMGKTLIFEGKNIERYLIVTPGFINLERIDRDRIAISTDNKRGRTTLLIWEDHGRWSFNVQVTIPISRPFGVDKDVWQEEVEPFRFDYSSDWSTYYSDQDLDEVKRTSLNFTQRMLLAGETPYGNLDSSVTFEKKAEKTVATGYSVGLIDGQIGPISNFNIRGFDARKTFSPLTLSGKYFRGILFEQRLFDDAIEYSYINGQDRATYGIVSPEIISKDQSFITGGQIRFFPYGDHQYNFNYAEGWGSDRESYLADQNMSFQTFQKFGELDLSAEIAHDEENFARTAHADFPLNSEMDLSLDFRDIEKDYTTVVSNPSGQGEVGGIMAFFWHPESFSLDSSFNVYKDRLTVNPENPYAYNYDLSVSLRKPFEEQSATWNTDVYWLDTAGLISPYRDFRIYNYLTKNFDFLSTERMGSVTLRQSYQRSRYSYSPSSEYDRIGLGGGIRVPVLDWLSYYLDYDYYFVDEILSGNRSQPRAMTTGLSYRKDLTDSIFGNIDLSYRNEQEAESSFSFLAGEDSTAVTAGLSYRPNSDFDIYLDATARKTWPEDSDIANYFEADIRLGARTSWELPVRWNPQGHVGGTVFKDMNMNGVQDSDEKGIPGITLKVGKKETTTDENGRYLIKISGKKVQIGMDFDSVPKGYIFTTPLYAKVKIVPHKIVKVDFGLSTSSGVYGVVYYDKNQSKKPDSGDEFIHGVHITLEGKEAVTDFEGSYSFDNVEAGEHKIAIDVNSIPMEYLPLIKLTNKIDVQEGTTYIFHIPVKKKE
ncbi:MAG: SdrD B-like domain-containing protein [Candidatus Aceula meridiana]|nr:SdrD B-like domain-containing protein [Candidatus Aceula meridiana]